MLGRLRFAEINTGVQPCEPKPRHAEARKTRPAGFGTRTFAPPVDRVGQKAGAGISAEPKPQAGSGSRNAAHPKQLFSYIILQRHYAASGLLNLHKPRWYEP